MENSNQRCHEVIHRFKQPSINPYWKQIVENILNWTHLILFHQTIKFAHVTDPLALASFKPFQTWMFHLTVFYQSMSTQMLTLVFDMFTYLILNPIIFLIHRIPYLFYQEISFNNFWMNSFGEKCMVRQQLEPTNPSLSTLRNKPN